jgi:hypothetical protein
MAAQSKFLNPRLGKSVRYLMPRLLASILAICGLAELAHAAPLTPPARYNVYLGHGFGYLARVLTILEFLEKRALRILAGVT